MIKALERTDEFELALKYRYESIIDLMLSNPQMKQYEIAAQVGCTQAWISQIISSDGFTVRYQQRRQQLNDEQDRNISAKIYEIADEAADRVLDELKKGDDCDAGFALDAQTRSLRAMGYGINNKTVAPSVITPALGDGVSAQTLKLAREAIASQSIVMTRVTESVQISPGEESQKGSIFEIPAELGDYEAVPG